MYQPLVSIVIPVYNGSNFVKEAIDSALNQTYKNIEVIVVNDGSRDEGATEQIAISYGDKIKYIYKENGGASTALNMGIANMSGEYFSWLSHDDVYKPEKIEKEIEALNEYGLKDVLVYCDIEQIDKNSSCITPAKKNKHLKLGVNKHYDALNIMLGNGTYNGCAFLVPKKAFDLSGGFDEKLRYSQDTLMWAKIFLNKFDVLYTSFTGVSSRVHEGQLTQRGREIFIKDSNTMSEYLIPKIMEDKDHASGIIYSYAYHNAIIGNKQVVKNCLDASKEDKLISAGKRFKIKCAKAYGNIRPTIRRIYYRVVRGMKTN